VFERKLNYDTFIQLIDDKYINTVGDSEDPRSIQNLKDLGMRITKAIKGPGSKMGGIMWLMRQKIYIVESCTNSILAFESYAWKKDKRTGESIDEPSHDFSHIPDALRYASERYSRGGRGVSSGHSKYI
jgi:phage terminase large subunit